MPEVQRAKDSPIEIIIVEYASNNKLAPQITSPATRNLRWPNLSASAPLGASIRSESAELIPNKLPIWIGDSPLLRRTTM